MTAIRLERLIVSLILIGIPAWLLASGGAAPSGAGVAFDAGFVPRLVLGLWLALGIVALLQDLLVAPAAPAPLVPGVLAVLVAAFVGVAVLMPHLGFWICCVGFCLLAYLATGGRSVAACLVIALLLPSLFVAIFNFGLRMVLPSSPFAWWF